MTAKKTDLPIQHLADSRDHASTACGADWEYHADDQGTQVCPACSTKLDSK